MPDPIRRPCPGACGTNLPATKFTCRPCWRRVPAVLRSAATDALRNRGVDPERNRQVEEMVLTWLAAHPAPPRFAVSAPATPLVFSEAPDA